MPFTLLRNTFRNTGATGGVKLRKNSIAKLNHVYNILETQDSLSGTMQTNGHDLYEIDDYSTTFYPRLCTDSTHLNSQSQCDSLGGCSWDGTQCTGFPSTLDTAPHTYFRFPALRM